MLSVGVSADKTIDTLMGVLNNTPPASLLVAFRLMYPSLPLENGPVFLTRFTRGLSENHFFDFVKTIRKLS